MTDGKLIADALKDFSGKPKKFTERSHGAGLSRSGWTRQAGLQSETKAGNLELAIDYPFMVFHPVGWLQNKSWNYFVLGVSLGIMGLALLLCSLGSLLRCHYGQKLRSLAGVYCRLRILR